MKRSAKKRSVSRKSIKRKPKRSVSRKSIKRKPKKKSTVERIPVGKNKTFPLGRDSKTGEFIPVREARRRPNTTTIERIPKSGYGDTGEQRGPRPRPPAKNE